MITLRKLISISFILILLTQCNSRQNEVTHTDNKFEFKPYPIFGTSSIHPTSYIGEWSYSFPFYSSELLVNDDGTFKFHEQGCTGHGYSEGKWTNYGTNILLTSLERYTKNEFPELIEVKSETKSVKPKKKNTKGKIEYFLDPSIFNTTVTYRFGPGDTTNVYFENVQLRIVGDTLYRLDKKGFQTDTKYVMSKNR